MSELEQEIRDLSFYTRTKEQIRKSPALKEELKDSQGMSVGEAPVKGSEPPSSSQRWKRGNKKS